MKRRHKLLNRQIELYLSKHLEALAPEAQAHLQEFVTAVEKSYDDYEADRRLLERSMEVSSSALTDTNYEYHLQNVELKALYRVSQALHGDLTSSLAYSSVAMELIQSCNLAAAAIELLDLKTEELKPVAMRLAHSPTQELSGSPYLLAQAPFAVAFAEGRPVFMTGKSSDLRLANLDCKGLDVHFMVAVPILFENELLGVISAVCNDAATISSRTVELLENVANQLASYAKREFLYSLNEEQREAMIAGAKMSELGKMAGGIAHEINTPLNTILLLAEAVSEELETGNKKTLSGHLENIVETVMRISSIVKGLRVFAREGSSDPFEPADVEQIIDETVSLCGERFRFDGIDIRIECASGVRVNCRKTQISQVLINLLNNAHDAVMQLEERWVIVQVRDTGDGVEIGVMDSGSGVPKFMREKLMMPFFTTKDVGSGLGLGLSISRALVDDHRGRLELDANSLNTRFVIHLPKDPLAVASAKSA